MPSARVWDVHLLWPSDTGSPVLGLSDSDQNLYHWPPMHKPLDSGWMAPPAFLNLQLTDNKLWYFLASVITWPLPLINLLLPIVYLLYWCSRFKFLFSCSMFRLMLYNLFLVFCSHCFTNCFPQFLFTVSVLILNDKGEDTDSFAVHSLSHVWLFTRLLCPCNFPGENTEVGCHFFLQRVRFFATESPGKPTLTVYQSLKKREKYNTMNHTALENYLLYLWCVVMNK